MTELHLEFTPQERANAEELWSKCRIFLSTLIDPASISNWIEPIEPRGYREHELTLRVPTEEFFLYLSDHFVDQFNLMQQVYMPQPDAILSFEYKAKEVKSSTPGYAQPELVTPGRAEDYVNVLNDNLSFETFIESESNRFARLIAEAVATRPGQAPHNVLFIHGASGVGKTHLSQAIALRVRSLYPEKKVCYVSCAKFEAQFVYDSKELRNKYSFIEFYQQMDVLIIDDIQSLIGKVKTQQAFFEIFNHLYLLNKQIVLTCDMPPVAFHDMEERIITRIQGSMIVPLERPDLELRRKILKNRIAEAGVELGEEVVEYIAENLKSNVRELDGTMRTLVAYAQIQRKSIDIAFASSIMGQSINMVKPLISMEQIVRLVSDEYDLDEEDLRSSSRAAKIALPRQIVMYLTNKHTDQTLVAIARRLRRKNHTTVLHGIRSISNRLETDSAFQQTIQQLEEKLTSCA